MSEKMSGNTYRITIEAIGPEKEVFNFGAPMIVECDGFFVVTTDPENTGIIAQTITPQRIAQAINHNENTRKIMVAMMAEQFRAHAMNVLLGKDGEKEASA